MLFSISNQAKVVIFNIVQVKRTKIKLLSNIIYDCVHTFLILRNYSLKHIPNLLDLKHIPNINFRIQSQLKKALKTRLFTLYLRFVSYKCELGQFTTIFILFHYGLSYIGTKQLKYLLQMISRRWTQTKISSRNEVNEDSLIISRVIKFDGFVSRF